MSKNVTAEEKLLQMRQLQGGSCRTPKGEKGESMIAGFIGFIIGGLFGTLMMGLMCASGNSHRCEECKRGRQ